MKIILLVLAFFLFSCDRFHKGIVNFGGATNNNPGSNSGGNTSGGHGSGSCTGYTPVDFNLAPNTDVTINGQQIIFSKNAIAGSTEEVVADLVFTKSTGKSYLELKLDGVSGGQDVNSYSGLVIGKPDQTAVVKIVFSHINSVLNFVEYINNVVTRVVSPPIVGTIATGYVIGVEIDHDTGDFSFIDNLGNSTFLMNIPSLAGIPSAVGVLSLPGDDTDETSTLTVNLGSQVYVNLPSAGSEDWCGNPI